MSPVFHCIYNPNWRWVVLSVFLWRLGKTTVMLTCRCSQQRPDHCKLVNALFAWIAEADQNPQVICRDDLQEDQMVYIDLAQVERVHTKGIIENQEIRKVGVSETHASGNREASTHNDWWKANWWNKYQQEGSRRTWNDEVWEFFKRGSVHTLSEPRRRIEDFFCQDGHGVINVHFFSR